MQLPLPSVTRVDVVAGERAAHHLIEGAAAAPGLRADVGLGDGEVRAVEQRFGEEGIVMPYPVQEVRVLSPSPSGEGFGEGNAGCRVIP